MADHQDMAAVRAAAGEVALGLAVDLADQRAGRVQVHQVSALGLGRDGFGHAVGGEHDLRVGRHLVQLLDEDRALGFQVLDHGAVVDDLVPDIDRRAVAAERFLDHADGTVHPGAEAARAGQHHAERAECRGGA